MFRLTDLSLKQPVGRTRPQWPQCAWHNQIIGVQEEQETCIQFTIKSLFNRRTVIRTWEEKRQTVISKNEQHFIMYINAKITEILRPQKHSLRGQSSNCKQIHLRGITLCVAFKYDRAQYEALLYSNNGWLCCCSNMGEVNPESSLKHWTSEIWVDTWP